MFRIRQKNLTLPNPPRLSSSTKPKSTEYSSKDQILEQATDYDEEDSEVAKKIAVIKTPEGNKWRFHL